MTPYTLFALSGLTVGLFLSSCSKHHDPTPIVDPPQVATININLAATPVAAGALEVIISENSGKVLLDTLGPINNSLVATLHTNQKLLDYTLIDYNSYSSQYEITTYKAVDLSNWTSLFPIDYSPPIPPLSSRQASILYVNAPLYNAVFIRQSDYAGGNGFGQISGPAGTYGFTYDQHGTNNYLYLLFEGTGLYNFHIPKGLTDTVDLSHMDTAVRLNFNLPAGYKVTSTFLIGIMDTTDFGRSMLLYSSGSYAGAPDMEYPRKVVQKLESYVDGGNGKGNTFSYYGYGDSVPATLPVPDASAYTISSSKNTNFSVKFALASPSYYYCAWNGTAIRWTLNCAPDSTTLNPLGLLTSLNSKMLKGQDLSSLAAGSFGFESAQGFKYQDFFSYVHNADMLKTRRVPVAISFSQAF
ncbi:MAG TPA: hypothetical protein VL727_24645 [Puia sp.]|nr:hypothetical protein [Puia sp.]